jgi:predicted dehydrogenase
VAAAGRAKHVFTEKPLALTLRQRARGDAGCAAAGVDARGRLQLAVPARVERRSSACSEDGPLGKLLHLEGNFCGPARTAFRADHWRHERREGRRAA